MSRVRRRLVAIAAAWLGIVPGCSSSTGGDGEVPAASPGLELAGEDYPRARRSFSTRLIREGPASREYEPIRAPAGAIAVEYSSAGRTLKALASPPRSGSGRAPGLLFLHGGFALGAGHWEMTGPFREAGYVVMVPSLRGENGQGGSFSLFHDEVDDALAAADALAARADVDPKRLYVAGHSVGGTLTLLAALTSDRFRAAASFSGSPDQVQYTRNRPERTPFDLARPGELRIRSPVAFADRFRCPVRLYFGDEEYGVQSATRRTASLAHRPGLDVEAVEVAGGHDTVNAEGVASCLRFFRAH